MPTDTNVREELETLIRARYPIIYILTHEEKRLEEVIRVIANERSRKLAIWSRVRGLMPPSSGSEANLKIDPEVKVLVEIEYAQEGTIFLLRDFHPYLSDVRVIRQLRDIAEMLSTKNQTILIVGPVMKLPVELEKVVTVLDFGLPGPDEIEQTIHDTLLSVKDNPKLKIEMTPEQREAIIHAAQGLTLDEVKNVLARSLIRKQTLDVNEVLAEKQQIIRKSGILEYYPQDVTLGDVGGLENLKDWLRKRNQSFTQKARDFGLPAPKGVLLLGVQGGGKSLSAKSVAALWNLPLLRMDMGRIFGSLVGASEENMRRALRTAESVAPCVLWLDELEKGLSGTESSGSSDGGTTSRVFSTFLTWMQEKTAPVFLVATANDVTKLPPELLRKGRFDEIFFIDLPTLDERKEIVNIHLKKRKRDPQKFDVNKIATAMEGFSGAEIEQAIVASLFTAFDKNREVETKDIVEEAKAAVPLSRMMVEEITELREWARLRARPASKPPEAPKKKSSTPPVEAKEITA